MFPGKTSFVKLLTGENTPNSGIIEIGDTVVLGVYDQLGLKFEDGMEQKTVLEFVMDQVRSSESNALSEDPAEARKLLKQFEFPRSRWNERVFLLSGGERRRLQLLKVLSHVSLSVCDRGTIAMSTSLLKLVFSSET